jgi:hypothetical protein
VARRRPIIEPDDRPKGSGVTSDDATRGVAPPARNRPAARLREAECEHQAPRGVTVRSIDTALGLDGELTDAQLTEYLDLVFRAVLKGRQRTGRGRVGAASNYDRAGGPLVVRPGTQLRPDRSAIP